MRSLQRGVRGEKGVWWQGARGAIYVSCPSCGFFTLIERSHAVGPGGKITPSLVCPLETCSFHDHVTLDDYP